MADQALMQAIQQVLAHVDAGDGRVLMVLDLPAEALEHVRALNAQGQRHMADVVADALTRTTGQVQYVRR